MANARLDCRLTRHDGYATFIYLFHGMTAANKTALTSAGRASFSVARKWGSQNCCCLVTSSRKARSRKHRSIFDKRRMNYDKAAFIVHTNEYFYALLIPVNTLILMKSQCCSRGINIKLFDIPQ